MSTQEKKKKKLKYKLLNSAAFWRKRGFGIARTREEALKFKTPLSKESALKKNRR